MTQQQPVNTLFDLLARTWERPAAVAGAVFNADLSAVAFPLADGTVSLARVADPESALSRVRISGDLGQNTIRPRTRLPRPVETTEAFGPGAPPVAALGASDFAVGAADGTVRRLTPPGEQRPEPVRLDGPVVSVASADAGRIAAATDGATVVLWSGRDGSAPRRQDLGGAARIGALAFSHDGRLLAMARADGVSILDVGGTAPLRTLRLPGRPSAFAFGPDDRWLAAPMVTGGFALVDLDDGRSGTVLDFPGPVRSVAFSAVADALVASGAFRIAGWSMKRPPIGDDSGGAIATGRAGLVLVEAVAAHPDKPLVAAGYANGQILVARPGARDELIVKPAGGAVTVLAWSADGRHLAAGCADGAASLVTFPPQMFK